MHAAAAGGGNVHHGVTLLRQGYGGKLESTENDKFGDCTAQHIELLCPPGGLPACGGDALRRVRVTERLTAEDAENAEDNDRSHHPERGTYHPVQEAVRRSAVQRIP